MTAMGKFLSVVSRVGLAPVVEPIARGLLRVGVTPNAVTVAGSVGVIIGSVGFAARGHILAAVVICTVCALTDLLDGTMARLKGPSGKWGALLDSTVDRVSDSAVLASIAYWYATSGQHRPAVVAILCLILGQLVSYVKARAEGLGFSANVGFAERAERLILVGVGGLVYGIGWKPGLEIALWVLVLLSVVTIGQRMTHVYGQAMPKPAPAGMSAPTEPVAPTQPVVQPVVQPEEPGAMSEPG
jgi:CDP-diacylglycerol--glycerol-3-phosphate 3-phosphatidyltransferase